MKFDIIIKVILFTILGLANIYFYFSNPYLPFLNLIGFISSIVAIVVLVRRHFYKYHSLRKGSIVVIECSSLYYLSEWMDHYLTIPEDFKKYKVLKTSENKIFVEVITEDICHKDLLGFYDPFDKCYHAKIISIEN